MEIFWYSSFSLVLLPVLKMDWPSNPSLPFLPSNFRLPPMGWMSWTAFYCETDCNKHPDACINAALYEGQADRLGRPSRMLIDVDRFSCRWVQSGWISIYPYWRLLACVATRFQRQVAGERFQISSRDYWSRWLCELSRLTSVYSIVDSR